MNNTQKKIFIALFGIVAVGIWMNFSSQKEVSLPEGDLFFFYTETCPHCLAEKAFLESIEGNYPNAKIIKLNLSSQENVKLWEKFYEKYKVPEKERGTVPATFTKDKYFIGFDESIGQEIKDYLQGIQSQASSQPEIREPEVTDEKIIMVPYIGEVKASEFSPFLISAVMGTVDGFNMCSLGALILILGLVVGLRSKIKIIIYGGIYILTTAIVYGVLIIFWYKLFGVLTEYMKIMQLLIGALGIGAGIYFLQQFWKFRKYGPTCDLGMGSGFRNKLSAAVQEIFKKPGNFLLVTGAILLFAAVITTIEFPCSALVPVAYAGILSHLNLSAFSHFFYIFVYILFYMIDEIIIFSVAILTSTIWLASGRFVTYFTLIEAIFLLLLGAFYLFGGMLF